MIEKTNPRPSLPYIEFHLTEHCNLNCKRCGHFSPIAPDAFADPAHFGRDLRQLAKRFETIGMVRLMGGEPLLHPEVESFIEEARTIGAATDLRIVTNGLLLKTMPDTFWNACRRNRVIIDLSLYPVMEKAIPDFQRLCLEHQVPFYVRKFTSFSAWINVKGDSDPQAAMTYCRSKANCPFLHESRLYVCCMPPTVRYYNDRFGRSIPGDAGIDIYDESLDGPEILRRLNLPVATCSYCSCGYSVHPWERGGRPESAEYEAASLPR